MAIKLFNNIFYVNVVLMRTSDEEVQHLAFCLVDQAGLISSIGRNSAGQFSWHLPGAYHLSNNGVPWDFDQINLLWNYIMGYSSGIAVRKRLRPSPVCVLFKRCSS
jgi:hypothetical protein